MNIKNIFNKFSFTAFLSLLMLIPSALAIKGPGELITNVFRWIAEFFKILSQLATGNVYFVKFLIFILLFVIFYAIMNMSLGKKGWEPRHITMLSLIIALIVPLVMPNTWLAFVISGNLIAMLFAIFLFLLTLFLLMKVYVKSPESSYLFGIISEKGWLLTIARIIIVGIAIAITANADGVLQKSLTQATYNNLSIYVTSILYTILLIIWVIELFRLIWHGLQKMQGAGEVLGKFDIANRRADLDYKQKRAELEDEIARKNFEMTQKKAQRELDTHSFTVGGKKYVKDPKKVKDVFKPYVAEDVLLEKQGNAALNKMDKGMHDTVSSLDNLQQNINSLISGIDEIKGKPDAKEVLKQLVKKIGSAGELLKKDYLGTMVHFTELGAGIKSLDLTLNNGIIPQLEKYKSIGYDVNNIFNEAKTLVSERSKNILPVYSSVNNLIQQLSETMKSINDSLVNIDGYIDSEDYAGVKQGLLNVQGSITLFRNTSVKIVSTIPKIKDMEQGYRQRLDKFFTHLEALGALLEKNSLSEVIKHFQNEIDSSQKELINIAKYETGKITAQIAEFQKNGQGKESKNLQKLCGDTYNSLREIIKDQQINLKELNDNRTVPGVAELYGEVGKFAGKYLAKGTPLRSHLENLPKRNDPATMLEAFQALEAISKIIREKDGMLDEFKKLYSIK